MRLMKKYAVLLLAVIVLPFILVACGGGANKADPGGGPADDRPIPVTGLEPGFASGQSKTGPWWDCPPGPECVMPGRILRNTDRPDIPDVILDPTEGGKAKGGLDPGGQLAVGTSFQEFVFEFPPGPTPTPIPVIIGPGGQRGIAMPGGLNDPRVFIEPIVERVELEIKDNWVYEFDFQPPGGSPDLCVVYKGFDGTVEYCQDLRFSDGPVLAHGENPGDSYFEIRHFPDDTTRHVLTMTGTGTNHGSSPDDATPVEVGARVAGSLRQGIHDNDWFVFQAQAEEWYELHLSLELEGDLGYYLHVSPPSGGQRPGFVVLNPLTFQAETTGHYTVELSDLSGGGDRKPATPRPYTFTVKRCANHPLTPAGCGG